MKNTFGNALCVTIFGESHGKSIGAVIDGLAPGMEINLDYINEKMALRRPAGAISTARREPDPISFESGVFEGKTTGTPLCIRIENSDTKSSDYAAMKSIARPGHADYSGYCKYEGFGDYRGGGRSSGRETTARVAAGAVAAKVLKELGIEVFAYTKAIGPVQIDENRFSKEERDKNALYMPDAQAAAQAEEYLQEKMKELDSCGGIVECVITGMPVGVGEPVFDKLSANLGKAILSIGAVKGFEIGDGFAAAASAGSENNDDFYNDNGTVKKKTNHAGGVLGGMSDGSVITFRAAFKPTPSIAQPQQTVNREGEDTEIVIHGRHDPIIVPRAVVVVETMAAVTVLDLLLQNMGSSLEGVKNFYRSDKK